MNQNSIIAFSLIVGFIVFITVRGELPAYLAVLGLGAGATSGTSNLLGGLTGLGGISSTIPGSTTGTIPGAPSGSLGSPLPAPTVGSAPSVNMPL